MSESSFEKQAQQKMDELRLHPSDKIWEGVEKKILKAKKRRRAFLLLPLLLLVCVGSWLLYNEYKADDSFFSNAQQIPIIVNNTTPVLSDSVRIDVEKEGNKPHSLPSYQTEAAAGKPIVYQKKSGFTTEKKQTDKKNITTPVVEDTDEQVTVSEWIEKSEISEVMANVKSDSTALVAFSKNNKNDSVDTISTPKEFTAYEAVPLQDIIVEEKDTLLPNEHIAPLVKNKKNKWRFGFELLPGISTTKRGSLLKQDKVLYAADVMNNPGLGYSQYLMAPPDIIAIAKKNTSLGVSVFMQKELSRSTSTQFNLGYSYLSSQINVGAPVQGVALEIRNSLSSGVRVGEYYKAATSGANRYVNAYHMVELGAQFSWKVIRKEKFWLGWDNGISINRLISSNALLFDENIKGYYRDFGAFNKNHFLLSSGISFPILHSKKLTLSGVAAASYGLTPLLKQTSRQNAHFLNYSMGLKFLWNN